MSTTAQPIASWVKQIPGELYKLDEKPLLGFSPEFPWAEFSANLANSLQIKEFSITPGDLQWRAAGELYNGLDDRLMTHALSVSPLTGTVWWVMPEQGVSRLMHLLLNPDSKVFAESIDDAFFKAFYQFLAAEAINSFEKITFDKKLSPLVSKEAVLPAEASLCLDVSIKLGEESIYGRLLLSQEFRKSWAQYYFRKQQALNLASPIADALNVMIHLEAGRVDLKPSEWKEIIPGDFVILDSCSLDPDEDKGRVMLVINGVPCFRAKIKQGSLKILEHPLYHEVETAMSLPPKKNDDEAFDDADFDFDDDEHEEHTDEHQEHSDEHTEEEHTDLDEEEDDDDIDISDEDIHATKEQKPAPGATPAAKSSEEAAPKDKLSDDAGKTTIANTPLTLDDIPLSVVIEVGRIQMSVKKLLELQPGNMLDLDIHPESGVDMVVNGRRIARGELLKIGDSLGIRISELS